MLGRASLRVACLSMTLVGLGALASCDDGTNRIGSPCLTTRDCGAFLVCVPSANDAAPEASAGASDEATQGSCEASHSRQSGSSCLIADDCVAGLLCLSGRCAPGGPGQLDDPCQEDANCRAATRCALEALSPHCVPQGAADIGAECRANADCRQGLSCDRGKCKQDIYTPWVGVTCQDPELSPVRAYFEVPDDPDAENGDFFRFPFPSDAAKHDGGLDLRRFPLPGSYFAIKELAIAPYVHALARESAWGTTGTVTFRFSADVAVEGSDIAWVDITPGSSDYGVDEGVVSYYRADRSAYVCEHSLSVRRPQGKPMAPGHSYAVWLKRATAADGSSVSASPNFRAVLADAEPDSEPLRAVYASFAPLRDYLTAQHIASDDLIDATVITVADVREPMASLASAVHALPAPPTRAWVKCGEIGRASCRERVSRCV